LDDYAKEDTVKCILANLNEEIVPDAFSYSGNPIFSYETFKKYSNGNHYARVYVEVEYKPKDLDLPESIFNTANGINEYIKDLKDLHDIMNIRSIAYNKKKIKLEEFIWRGIIYFDQFGQAMYLYDQKYLGDKQEQFIKNNTIYKDVFYSYCETYSGTFRRIPKQDEICPQCGKGWTIDNIADYVVIKENNKYVGYNKECSREHKNTKQLQEFKDILSEVYNLDKLRFTEIPNEYCPCERCASWFTITTPDGDVKIGWRKRVINIRWLDNYKQFYETFESEDVTKGFNRLGDRFIHAWSIEKTIEYLIRAKESITV
jgi:hypothetical protein